MNFDKLPEAPPATWWEKAKPRLLWTLSFLAIAIAIGWGILHSNLEADKSELELRQKATAVEKQLASLLATLPTNEKAILSDQELATLGEITALYEKLGTLQPTWVVRHAVAVEARQSEARSTLTKRAREKSLQAEKEARQYFTLGNQAAGLAALQSALEYQREANAITFKQIEKDLPRETALDGEVVEIQATPIYNDAQAKVAAAREAAIAGKTDASVSLLLEAKALFQQLNTDYGRSVHADTMAIGRIDTEIASVRTANLAAEIENLRSEAKTLAAQQKSAEAVEKLEEAKKKQNEINIDYPNSRYASNQALSEISAEIETSLAAPDLLAGIAHGQQVAPLLAKRKLFEALEQVRHGLELLESVRSRYPLAQGIDDELKARLAYLDVRQTDIAPLQDGFYNRLRPLPTSPNQALLNSEVSQDDFSRIMNTNPSAKLGRNLPVESVLRSEAVEFCRRLSWILGVPVRLPTAAEMQSASSSYDFTQINDGLNEWVAEPGQLFTGRGLTRTTNEEQRDRSRGFRVVVDVDLRNPPWSQP